MDPATVERSTLDWSEPAVASHGQMLDLYRSLIVLRRSHPELSDPSLDGFTVDVADDDSWLVMHRGSLRVVVNFVAESFEVRTSEWSRGHPEHVLLSWRPDATRHTEWL